MTDPAFSPEDQPPLPQSSRLRPRPIVIAHRGASGLRPEHTLAAYELAIDQGADFIEPDLVLTRDDVFVCRHENEIGDTTDVAMHPEFAGRRTERVIDGAFRTGWFTEDFTLAELKTLRARERLPLLRPGNVAYDGAFQVPTLGEVIALAKRRSGADRTIGIYPETKHPSWFAAIGHPMELLLVEQLRSAGWDAPGSPVFIQSFEVANLKRLRALTGLRLIQLIDAEGSPADQPASRYAAMVTPEGLREIASYAWGIGPAKTLIADGDAPASGLVDDAHAVGLGVHAWTFRAENAFLPPRLRRGVTTADHGDLSAEIGRFLALGVDGFFTDFPAIGLAARASDAQVRG